VESSEPWDRLADGREGALEPRLERALAVLGGVLWDIASNSPPNQPDGVWLGHSLQSLTDAETNADAPLVGNRGPDGQVEG
jgi:hypothetical protein